MISIARHPHAVRACALVLPLLLAAGCGDDDVTDPAPQATASAVFAVNSLGETLARHLIVSGETAPNALAVGAQPNDMVVAADGATGYVVCSGDNRLDVVALDELALRRSIDLGPGASPYAIALAGPDDAYVSNWLTGEVAHVDLAGGTVHGTIAVGPGPEGLLFAPDAGRSGADAPAGALYVAVTRYRPDWTEVGELVIVHVPADTVAARIPVGTNPQAVTLAPDGILHVVCTGDYAARAGQVVLVDPVAGAVVDSVAVAGSPVAALALAGGVGYTVGFAGGLRRYDVAARVSVEAAAIRGAGFLTALAYDGEDDLLYVSDFDDDRVYAVALAADTLWTTFASGDGPIDLALRR
jgi:DNA-binding beta-propeller fold protein YncE